jgi:hypothetical protein
MGCAGTPESAGNATIHFVIDAHGGRGDAAYRRLCQDTRARTSPSELEQASGEFGGPLSLGGARGEAKQYDDVETIGSDITEAWTEIEGTRNEMFETWRFQMRREDGKWRICSAEFRSRREIPPDFYEIPGTSLPPWATQPP